MKEDGTTIVIGSLRDEVSARFGHDKASFEKELVEKISTHYAFIIAKGFEVRVNSQTIQPRPTKLVFADPGRSKNAVRPYIYDTEVDGVRVFLAVGFTRPIPGEEEVESEMDERKYSKLEAGWTVVCNDRAVLYCDKTELTGWGEAGVPEYHSQFIAITGIVEFRSDDAAKLPTTTTKRGIEASSKIYLQVKNKMREGMSIFTDYTNKWKSDPQESKKHIRSGEVLSFDDIKKVASTLPFTPVKKGAAGKQYKPSLPLPSKTLATTRRISFSRDIEDIRVVGQYLLGNPDAHPNAIGESCFAEMLRRARK